MNCMVFPFFTNEKPVVSERGVVFLRDQVVTPTQMKDLMLRITSLAGSVRILFSETGKRAS